jgi:hypothetical protein
MSKTKSFGKAWMIAAAITMTLSSQTFADTMRIGGNGGEGVPTLNDLSSIKVELADGEAYTLAGNIAFLADGQPYLKVDLKQQPWLANSKRISFPYYALTGGADFWRSYEGNAVQYMCIAAGTIASDGEYQISLKPVKSLGDSLISDTIPRAHH